MKKLCLGVCLVGGLLAACAADAHVRTRTAMVMVGPPAPRVEIVPPPPRASVVWVSGYWRWGGRVYRWVPGHYVVPPTAHVVWLPSAWIQVQGHYRFVPGRWVHAAPPHTVTVRPRVMPRHARGHRPPPPPALPAYPR
jgi:YXWGXW repeat-containing protein